MRVVIKLIALIEETIDNNHSRLQMPSRFYKRHSVIRKVLSQQSTRFRGGEVIGLIVSMDKDYVRPIVRGKETRRVEFGAKVNTIQVDGINFIEHLSFDTFNEGIRIPQCINRQQILFRKRVPHLAADRIYATDYNRKYCSKREITTSFVRKGRASKDEVQVQQMRNLLNRERSTRLESSFGTEKQHYTLDKVKARTKQTEILWIFFGIHIGQCCEDDTKSGTGTTKTIGLGNRTRTSKKQANLPDWSECLCPKTRKKQNREKQKIKINQKRGKWGVKQKTAERFLIFDCFYVVY
jgi:hypothetical protein